MIDSDVIVIGGGLAGLMAACVAVRRKEKVTVLTFGSGSLPLASGAIDFYNSKFPETAIKNLPVGHPYYRIGLPAIKDSINFLKDVTARANLPYTGDLSFQIPIVTAVGTLKYSTLIPESMDASLLGDVKKIFVVGIRGIKDFYPRMLVDNLKKYFSNADFNPVTFDLNLLGGRDINCMDAAQMIADNDELFINELKGLNATPEDAIIIPPVLGTTDNSTRVTVKTQLHAALIETTCLPPAPTGVRLQRALTKYLEDNGARIYKNANVFGGVVEENRITGVVTKNSVREKFYPARKFILATGGFYGGGIVMREFDKPHEPIFDLPVKYIVGEENWSNPKLFADKPQGFAATGIFVDSKMRPIDSDGQPLFENLHVIGANIGGKDFIHEKSLGGIAISSAYKAATI
ncbi:MAG: anaerobic glycerol-3-phosphate dehydrogenase subunit B [Selenomonadaceae bacterium]|nr:anaerobic glycerol-3-phosphate dehydrogenase subunit B [Selenomonadaceae bacterium]